MKTSKDSKALDKRILEQIFLGQQEELQAKRKKRYCSRKEVGLVDLSSPQAQVVIGVRRSGKSTMCFQALENAGVNYAYADFDDEHLSGMSSDQLDAVLEVLYKIYGNFSCLFLDEIQNVEGWHLFVNRLLRKDIRVVITGSNANLLSSELATYLTGRNKEIDLYPFSFGEYCEMKGIDQGSISTQAEAFRRAAFDDYLKGGGFPEKFAMSDSSSYVSGLVKNILVRDIEQRYGITFTDAFERMANHLLNVSPTIVSVVDLAALFDIKSNVTVRNYIKYLKDSFILVEVQKYSPKSRQRITQEKVYAVDVAMMDERENAFAGENLGWRLETIVLIELKRRCRLNGCDVYYLMERSYECDFVLCKGNVVKQAIQVAYDISSDKTRKREINGLLAAAKKTGCTELLLLTDHDYADVNVDEAVIKIRPVYDWCVGVK
ncbi:MAG: ATP-binding protein [Bacteroidales bacterium]|nr:ATP-binding protein [Bacteroidales bacterium]